MLRSAIALCLLTACGSPPAVPATPAAPPAPVVPPRPPPPRSVLILVWDGLRPDAIGADTPNLAALRDGGAEATDNHSTYPTFTMMNAASFATGAFPDRTGFYGNVVWQPAATGNDSAGKPVDFRQPVLSEDYAVLDDLRGQRPQLLDAGTLFEAARAHHLVTATLGKTGPAYLQDIGHAGVILDEKTALPPAFAQQLKSAGVALPPTAPAVVHRLKDGVTPDPSDESGSPYKAAVKYMVDGYLDSVLPDQRPRLTVLWLRDPDTTEHSYGVGSANWRDALKANDDLLGRIVERVRPAGQPNAMDIIVVSDHGHSNVSGPQSLFPLRGLRDGAVGDIDANGYSVSGIIRLADLLQRAGFTAFDGLGCTNLPVAMGIRKDGSPVYPDRVDRDGKLCGKPGQHYQIGPHRVPADPLPAGALVVAVNGGSDYIYVPDHSAEVVARAVRFLQSRAEVGAIFVDDRYGFLPGALRLSAINAQNAHGKNPDIILSYDYDEDAAVRGAHGTEMGGMLGGGSYRGMHGSCSPRDVHNTLILNGPDFVAGFRDPLPTGNVDVAPTVARILGLELPDAQGRPLLEAMAGGASVADYAVAAGTATPATPATKLTIALPTSPDGKDIARGLSSYNFELHTKTLSYRGRDYVYFDFAKATRH